MLAGVLDNDDELVVLSQVYSEADLTSFEKDFDLDMFTDEQCKAMFQFVEFCVMSWVSPRDFKLEIYIKLGGE